MPERPAALLEVESLDAWYGEAQALRACALTVAEGEVVTLVGRNGAGKTTLVRSLMGLHRQVSGRITFAGRDVTGLPSHRRARLGMGWVQDDRGVFANLSVEENLLLPPVVSDQAWSLAQVYDAFPALAERRRARGTSLSGGEQQEQPRPRHRRRGQGRRRRRAVDRAERPLRGHRRGPPLPARAGPDGRVARQRGVRRAAARASRAPRDLTHLHATPPSEER